MSERVSMTARRAAAWIVAIAVMSVLLVAAMQAGSANSGAAGMAQREVARHLVPAQDTNWG